MRSFKPLALLAVPAAALALSACGTDIQVGGDDIASADTTITADGHTYQVKNLQISDDSATAETKAGKTLTFEKVDGHWSLTR